MIPVLTPEEMNAVDAAAPESVEELIRRAAAAVSAAAIELLGGTYGRRVVVVAGPGNNGEDGRVAAELMRRRGVKVTVIDTTATSVPLPEADLVIDAAFGTGLRRNYDAPDGGGTPVLAVDICSGVSGLTGAALGSPAPAFATVTFAALKPGLLFADGPTHSGEILLADIGLDTSSAACHLVVDADVVSWIPPRPASSHKWRHAVWLIAGSPGMSGAPQLSAAAAMRGGAGYVRLSSPGVENPPAPIEVVGVELETANWAEEVLDGASRFAAIAIGPGLGRSDATVAQARALVTKVDRPTVVDGDALWALGTDVVDIVSARTAATVLTPHDGEFERLVGRAPGPDRIAAARDLAAECGAVVLLKGPTTVVADADGQCLLVRSGDARLATAGTGDVLTGLVAAHLAMGVEPLRAAASAAHLHGRAAGLGPERGLVASDLPDLLPAAWRSCGGED